MATDQMQQASFELVQRCAHADAAASNEFPFLEFNGFLNRFLNLGSTRRYVCEWRYTRHHCQKMERKGGFIECSSHMPK